MKDKDEPEKEISGENIAVSIFFLTLITISIIAFSLNAFILGVIAIGATMVTTTLLVTFPTIVGKITGKYRKEPEEINDKKLQRAIEDIESDRAKEEGKSIDGIHNAILMG